MGPCLHHSLYVWHMCYWLMVFFVSSTCSPICIICTLGRVCIPCMGSQDAPCSDIATHDVFPNASLHEQHHTSATHVMNSICLTQTWCCTCMAPISYWIHVVPHTTTSHPIINPMLPHHSPTPHPCTHLQVSTHTHIYIYIYIYVYICVCVYIHICVHMYCRCGSHLAAAYMAHSWFLLCCASVWCWCIPEQIMLPLETHKPCVWYMAESIAHQIHINCCCIWVASVVGSDLWLITQWSSISRMVLSYQVWDQQLAATV